VTAPKIEILKTRYLCIFESHFPLFKEVSVCLIKLHLYCIASEFQFLVLLSIIFMRKTCHIPDMSRGMWHLRRIVEVHTGFCWGDLKEREYLEDLGVDGRTILKRISRTFEGRHGLDFSG